MSNSVLGNWFYEANSEDIEIASIGDNKVSCKTAGGTFDADLITSTFQTVLNYSPGFTAVLSVDGNTLYFSNGGTWVRR